MKFLTKKRAKAALAVVVGTFVTSPVFAADKVTVDMPEIDLGPVSVWIGGIVVVVLGIGAIMFGMRKGNRALGS